MAKRGRKKGGLNVNKLNDRTEIINMIINQINTLNKKIKAFKKNDIEEHIELVKNIITDDMGKFTKNDTLSKSKKFYESKNIVWLKKSLTALNKLNKHEYYGTIRKYKSATVQSHLKVQNYVSNYLRQKGYSESFIIEVTTSPDFYVKLFSAFSEVGQGYGSDQVIEKVALDYEDTGFSDKEKEKILSNIEYSRNAINRIEEEQRAFEEFKRNRRKR